MATATRRKKTPPTELPISAIKVGRRCRKDVGNLKTLIESIERIGLLHPVVITPDKKLIAGFRRMVACKKLGWKKIPVRVVDLEQVIEGQFSENACRKGYTLSEVAAIAKKLRPIAEKQAHERRVSGLKQGNGRPVGKTLPNGQKGKARDIVARYVGISGMTLEKIEAVVEAAKEDPEKYGYLKDRMDATGKVNKHWQQLRVARLMAEAPKTNGKPKLKPNTIICGDCLDILPKFPANTFDAVIFDPPWGVNYTYDEGRERNSDPEGYWEWFQPIFKQTMRVLKPGGFWACWQSHNYFRFYWDWFGNDIRIFSACKDRARPRAGRTYCWEPIIMKWKPGRRPIYPYGRKKPLDFFVSDWAAHLANKLAGQHPCPRPVDLLEALIENYTTKNALILDPMCGSGSTCVAAKRLGRKYLGIEMSEAYAALARKRIEVEGKK